MLIQNLRVRIRYYYLDKFYDLEGAVEANRGMRAKLMMTYFCISFPVPFLDFHDFISFSFPLLLTNPCYDYTLLWPHPYATETIFPASAHVLLISFRISPLTIDINWTRGLPSTQSEVAFRSFIPDTQLVY